MNPHFFFSLLAPRLPHVMQGAEDTGCEVHDGRAGEESSGGVQLPRGVRFLQTVHQDADDISAALEHFVLVQEELDVETFQAVRQMTHLKCSWSSVMKRRSSCCPRIGTPSR